MNHKTEIQKAKSPKSSAWKRLPKWAIPILVVLAGVLIYLASQYIASFVVTLYALARGWNSTQANNWLTNSVAGQFFFILIFEAIIVGLIYFLLKHYGYSLKSIGLKKLRFKDAGYALMAYPVYLIVYLIIVGIVTHIYPGLNVSQSQNIGFNSVHGNMALTLTFISLVILPPIAEEILFRGFLFEGFKKAMPAIYAGIIVSVIFAAAHLPEGQSGLFLIGAMDVFTLSLVLVYLKQKTKTLWPGIILHSLKNLVAFISLFMLTNR